MTVIAGDFYTDLDNSVPASLCINKFTDTRSLVRADALFSSCKSVTSLKQESCIDYALISSQRHFVDFLVMDPDINFSDHLLLLLTLIHDRTGPSCRLNARSTNCDKPTQLGLQPRWDHADKLSYYE